MTRHRKAALAAAVTVAAVGAVGALLVAAWRRLDHAVIPC